MFHSTLLLFSFINDVMFIEKTSLHTCKQRDTDTSRLFHRRRDPRDSQFGTTCRPANIKGPVSAHRSKTHSAIPELLLALSHLVISIVLVRAVESGHGNVGRSTGIRKVCYCLTIRPVGHQLDILFKFRSLVN